MHKFQTPLLITMELEVLYNQSKEHTPASASEHAASAKEEVLLAILATALNCIGWGINYTMWMSRGEKNT